MKNRIINREVFSKEIKRLLVENHYTNSAPSAVKYCFVLRDLEQNVKGVILYSHFSRLQASRKYENCLELSRLWVVGGEPKNTASFFIGHTLRFLQNKTRLLGVVSYADTTEGHTGTVYKASNFKLLGLTARSYHYLLGGVRIHKKKVWRDAKKLQITEKAHAAEQGLVKVPEDEKLIFYFTFKRKQYEHGFIYNVKLPSGKCYIGQTVNPIEARVRRHVLDAKKGSPLRFHAALRKYNYEYEVELVEKVPIAELSLSEQRWISHFDSTNRDKGYNDPNAPLGILDRVPEDLLYQAFQLRQDGLTYQEIGDRFGLTSGYINGIIQGRSRPEIRARWIETNDVPEKYKSVADSTVLKAFELHDAGKSLASVARELDVTKTYISLLFHGKMCWDLKAKYELETGKPFVFKNTKRVDRELAKTIIHEKYSTGVTSVALAEKYDLSVDQVRDIVTGTTAKDVYDEYKKNHKITKNFKYSDDKLLSAFDMRFTQGMFQKDVSKQLGIDKSFLSMLFSGKHRTDVKEQWEAKNGPVPSKSEIKSQAAKLWRKEQKKS